MPDNLQRCLVVTDHSIALFLLFPISCCFWRGSWDLMGYYIFPNREPLGYWVMAAIGFCTVFNYIFLPVLNNYLDRQSRLYTPVSRLFLYYHSLLYMSFWRGVWELYNFYLGTDWRWSLLHLCTSLALLMSLKVLRSTFWPPLQISVDTRPNLLKASNRFKVNPSQTLLYIGDCFFSAVIIECLSMFTWRSVLNIMDTFIFPENPLKSDVVCLAFGAAGILLLFTCQPLLMKVSQRLSNISFLSRLIWEDVCCLVTFCFLTSLWRGGWNLNKEYLIPSLPLGAWVNHLTGAALMLVSQTFSCMSSFGVSIDGENPIGSAFFATRYIRYYLDKPDYNFNVLDDEATVKVEATPEDADSTTDEHSPLMPNTTIQYNTFGQ